ncbi:MAG: hypothetical protein KJO98_02655, partial [Rhodothermia bacterium]|nr:hypothetical protein [Rhodothermia bacterium]
TDRVYSVIDSLRAEGTTMTNLEKTRETWTASHQVGLEQNNSWLSWLQYYEQNGLDFTEIPVGLIDFLDSVTLEEIQEAANKYLDDSNRVRIVLYPEEWEARSGG